MAMAITSRPGTRHRTRRRAVDEAAAQSLAPVRMLVVEETPGATAPLRQGLAREGFDVAVECVGGRVLPRLESEAFNVVLVDMTSPSRGVHSLLEMLRGSGVSAPVVLQATPGTVQDCVRSLDSGADDYLVKPVAFAELLARLRAVLRRGQVSAPFRLEAGHLAMELVGRRVTQRGETVPLTPREFQLLECLMRHRERVVPRDLIAREVWACAERTSWLDNTIAAHISSLRRKIDPAGTLIHTVRGVGYILRLAH